MSFDYVLLCATPSGSQRGRLHSEGRPVERGGDCVRAALRQPTLPQGRDRSEWQGKQGSERIIQLRESGIYISNSAGINRWLKSPPLGTVLVDGEFVPSVLPSIFLALSKIEAPLSFQDTMRVRVCLLYIEYRSEICTIHPRCRNASHVSIYFSYTINSTRLFFLFSRRKGRKIRSLLLKSLLSSSKKAFLK